MFELDPVKKVFGGKCTGYSFTSSTTANSAMLPSRSCGILLASGIWPWPTVRGYVGKRIRAVNIILDS